MQKTSTLSSQDLYSEYLTTIKGIYFTRSEIDVISCILNIRGTKKIADFLSIEPSTFYRHIGNIMPKIGCNSQQAIIDFVEASDARSFLIKHYFFLKREEPFEKELKKISKTNQEKNSFRCFIQANEQNAFV